MELTVNRLPARTWNRLGMNEVRLDRVSVSAEGRMEAVTPDRMVTEAAMDCPVLDKIETGMGADMDRLGQTAGVPVHILKSPEKQKIEQPARLRFSFGGGEGTLNRIGLWAEKDSEMTVIMDYMTPVKDALSSSKKEQAPGDWVDQGGIRRPFAVQTKVLAQKNAKVRLICLQRLEEDAVCLSDIGILCEQGAKVEVICLMLGGKAAYLGCRAELAEEKSAFDADIGYLLRDSQSLDINAVAVHKGRETVSQMTASGALKGKARKLFRGTIDFRCGASGAEGEEKEDVLLLDDEVVNQSIPLILCGEEDVQGNHGATIGQLDEALLFYMQSRGKSREEIQEMMARARVDALCAKIPDEETREQVRGYLDSRAAADARTA